MCAKLLSERHTTPWKSVEEERLHPVRYSCSLRVVARQSLRTVPIRGETRKERENKNQTRRKQGLPLGNSSRRSSAKQKTATQARAGSVKLLLRARNGGKLTTKTISHNKTLISVIHFRCYRCYSTCTKCTIAARDRCVAGSSKGFTLTQCIRFLILLQLTE